MKIIKLVKKNVILPIALIITMVCNCQNNSTNLAQTVDQPKKVEIKSPNTLINDIPSLPIKHIDEIPEIGELKDDKLQSILEKEIDKKPYWRSLVDQNLMSVAIVDMFNTKNIKYAGINDNEMMYAASLPKIAILLAAMDAIDKGELKMTSEIKKDMHLMISKSNNKASTRMIDRVGYKKIESVLRSPQNNLYDEETGGGLWVGKRYGGGGDTNREPMKKLSHAATTRQVCSFYYQLAMGNLISDKRSKQMLEFMRDPALHHKFVNTLDKVAPNADIYRKSGSWRNYHSDSALVWGPKRRYIIVALIDNALGEKIIRELVVPLEKVMKKARAFEKHG